MAACVVNSRDEWVAGNKRIVTANLTVTTDDDTWVSGLGNLTGLVASCSTANTPVGASYTLGTATFHCTGGTVINVVAIGN